MSTLIILVAFSLGVAYFATQNTGIVHITLANFFTGGIPLYVVVIGSMLLGIFISWLISIVNYIFSTVKILGKEAKLKDAHRTIDTLNKENSDLLLENTRLKGEKGSSFANEDNNKRIQVEDNSNPSLSQRIKQSFA